MRATDGIRKISKTTRLIGGGVAAMAAVAGLFAANATPAFAVTYWEAHGAAGVEASGYHNFETGYCDISAVIKDTSADGHRTGVQLKNVDDFGPTTYAYRYNTSGNGTSVNRYFEDAEANSSRDLYVREFVSEGAIENGGTFEAKGDWVPVC